MGLTDSSDLFGAFHEDGLNDVIHHVMRKRPSLFNYATQWVAEEWEKRLCVRPDVAPEVLRHDDPVVTVEDPLPLLGTDGAYGLNFAAQLVDVEIDLAPSDIELPPELGAGLGEQQFVLMAQVCVGIGCPSERGFDDVPTRDSHRGFARVTGERRAVEPDRGPRRETIAIPTDRLECFCVRLYVLGHVALEGPQGAELVAFEVDGLEIVDVEPEGLESSLECYLRVLLQLVILPRLRMLLPVFVFRLLDGLATITLRAETGVPNNPAIEQDQLKAFVDVEVGP